MSFSKWTILRYSWDKWLDEFVSNLKGEIKLQDAASDIMKIKISEHNFSPFVNLRKINP